MFNYKEGPKTVSLSDIMDAVDKSDIRSDLSAVAAPLRTLIRLLLAVFFVIKRFLEIARLKFELQEKQHTSNTKK